MKAVADLRSRPCYGVGDGGVVALGVLYISYDRADGLQQFLCVVRTAFSTGPFEASCCGPLFK